MTGRGRSGSDGGINKELVNPDHFAGAGMADNKHLRLNRVQKQSSWLASEYSLSGVVD